MSKWIHRISDINQDTNECICQNCGLVNIKWTNNKDGYKASCAIGYEERKINWRLKNRGPKKNKPTYTKPHGLTFEEAKAYRANKNCAICGSVSKLTVDHSHKSNKIRDVLCHKCNVGIGMFDEDIDRLASAIDYIKYHL